MRSNIEQSRIWDSRFIATRLASVSFTMTGTLFLTKLSPGVVVLTLNGVDRDLYLPALSEERQYAVANVGTTGNLSVRDSGGAIVAVVTPGYMVLLFATALRWIFLSSSIGTIDPTGVTEALRVVTAAGAQVITAVEAGIVLNKSVGSATPVTIPLSSLRNGKPIRIRDFAGTTDITNPITITPSGGEKINNQSSWEVTQGGITLEPQPAPISGYTVVPGG